MKKKITLFTLFFGVLSVFAQQAPIKIDFNKSDRQEKEVHEPGYVSWVIQDCVDTTRVINGITFTLANGENSSGPSLKSHWYKAGLQTPYFARLVSDGVIVNGGDFDGGEIELTLEGLSAGKHTLLTYHNQVDAPTDKTFGEICIDVNGKQVVKNLPPTQRVLSNYDAATAYIEFEAVEGEPVKFRFYPNYSSSAPSINVIINGLALDVPNLAKQAKSPSPENLDIHVNAEDGNYTLSWTSAPDAVAHQVYIGTDSLTVAQADQTSSCYKGEQAHTTFALNDLTSRFYYYWRIDEVEANGEITKGDIWKFSPRLLAFPGAEGYGRFARGGRGGKVVYVTNLQDYDPTIGETPIPGSLRYAVTVEKGARTIVFGVSGIITLKTRLTLSDSFVTVAGQTSPNKGICLKGAPFGFSGTSDAVMRFMRIRIGAGQTYDGTGLNGANHCIFDHLSVSWSIDEAFSSRSGQNLTLQKTMLSEELNAADHQNYPSGTRHGYAATIRGDIGSFHHNLLAHNEGRNWSLGGGLDGDGNFAGRMDIFNNVVYNWDGRTTDGGAHEVNFVNNYYKPGPATLNGGKKTALNLQHDDYPGTQKYYTNGNIVEGWYEDLSNPQNGCVDGSWPNGDKKYDPFVTEPFFESFATVHTAKDAYKAVLSDVGCTLPMFDDHDVRIVKETLDGTATYKGSKTGEPGLIDHQDDAGGWEDYPEEIVDLSEFDTDMDGLPNWWEIMFGTNPESAVGDFSDANADDDEDGYTNLEEYLNYMAVPHTAVEVNKEAEFDLAPYFVGYSKTTPVYTVAAIQNATATVDEGILKVTPEKDFEGIVNVDVKVTDQDGASMVRSFAVRVGEKAVSTGIHSAKNDQEISVYPNPAVDYIYVSVQSDVQESVRMEITTLYGQVLSTETVATSVNVPCRVNVSDLPAGIYILKVQTADEQSAVKFIKK